jgi:MYXO-CTERM domain-containing protein
MRTPGTKSGAGTRRRWANVASRTTTVLSPLVTLAVLSSVPASAHVGDLIDTIDVSTRADGGIAVQGKFALAVADGPDAPLHFVCHEAITTEFAFDSPEYSFGPDGSVISRMADLAQARDGEPLWFTTDLCEWSAVPGFFGRIVADVAFGPDGSVWVVTADPAGAGGNAVFHGPDVNSLAPVLTADDAGVDRFLSVEPTDSAVWVTGSDAEAPVLLRDASASGSDFQPVPLDLPPDLVAVDLNARVVLATAEPSIAWVVLDPIGADRLLEVRDDAQTVIWAPTDRITDLSRAPDGTLYGTLGDRRPWRIPTDGPPEDLTAFADGGGLDAGPDGLLVAHRSFVNGLLYSTSADGLTPDTLVTPDAIVGPLECPAGTVQADVCAPLWSVLEPRLAFTSLDTADTGLPIEPPDIDEPTDDRADGCGCRTTSSGGLTALLGVLAVFGRRRRAGTPRS